ncbi:MAG: BrnA antitoxin family protein [Acidobacteria bacterium]|nr:BrnA antitoxin family protein [Acidobacteriota bacterium]
MSGNEHSTNRGSDPDAAPDLTADGWPEKFARATVRRGRPPSANPKVSTTIRLSRDVVEHFKSGGRGWQTRIDAALREWIGKRDVA